MHRPTQNRCNRPRWDNPARLIAAGNAERLGGGLAPKSRTSERRPSHPLLGRGRFLALDLRMHDLERSGLSASRNN